MMMIQHQPGDLEITLCEYLKIIIPICQSFIWIASGFFSRFHFMPHFVCALTLLMLCVSHGLVPPAPLSVATYWQECEWNSEPWSPAEEKCAPTHPLPFSLPGNYVFYLGDTYSYFNIGYPAVLMAHYSNKWGESLWGWWPPPCGRALHPGTPAETR